MSSPMALPTQTDGLVPTLIINFDALVGCTAALLALSTITVGLRVYVRTMVMRTFGLDDSFMIAAYVSRRTNRHTQWQC